MRVIHGAALAAWLLAGTGLAFGQSSPPQPLGPGERIIQVVPRWLRFTSVTGRFNVLTPRRMAKKVEDASPGMRVSMFQTREAGVIYFVGFIDYPEFFLLEKQVPGLFDNSAVAAARRMDGKIIGKRDFKVDGKPGRETRFVSGDKKTLLVHQAVVSGSRLYQLYVETAPDRADDPDIRKFLDSFRLGLPEGKGDPVKAPTTGADGKSEPSAGSTGGVPVEEFYTEGESAPVTSPEIKTDDARVTPPPPREETTVPPSAPPPSGPGGVRSATTSPKWVRMISRTGGVTALIPSGPVRQRTSTQDTALGPVNVTKLDLLDGRFRYVIAYFDYPEGVEAEKNAPKILDALTRPLAPALKGTLSDMREITLDGHPGVAFRLTSEDGKGVLVYRAFVVGRRLHQFLVSTGPDSANAPEIAKFLDSCALWSPKPGHFDRPSRPDEDIFYTTDDAEGVLLGFASPPPPPDNVPSSVTPSGPVRRSEGALRKEAVNRAVPKYPRDALAQRLSGDVQVEILIDETGKVVEARVIGGPREFHQSSLNAAYQWTFKPFLMNGTAVKVAGVLTFRFSVSG